MGTVLRVTSTPYESIRLTQSARLVPSDMVAVERQKALARYRSSQLRYHGGGYDLNYISQVHRAFSTSPQPDFTSAVSASAQAQVHVPAASSPQAGSAQMAASQAQAQTVSQETVPATEGSGYIPPAGSTAAASVYQDQPSVEASSAYTVERGAFEMRVAKGDVSYIPALAMTIVTQLPEVHFEYTGDFIYVPPRDEPTGAAVNMQI